MNFMTKASFGGLMLLSNIAFAVEPVLGWYVGGFVGPSYAPGRDLSLTPRPTDHLDSFAFLFSPAVLDVFPNAISYLHLNDHYSNGRASYNVLVNGGGQIGYRCNKFRYEAEVMINSNTIRQIRVNDFFTLSSSKNNLVYIKGNTSVLAGFFNVFYEFYDQEDADTQWVPYIGLGIGYASIKDSVDLYVNNRKNVLFSPYTSCTLDPLGCGSYRVATASQTSSAAIGQGIIGLSYFTSDALSFGTDLRYYSTRNIRQSGGRVAAFTWNFLINYSFDEPYY